MAQIAWKRGTFLKFFAQMKIRVGGKDTLDIQKDDEFEYDGSVVKYAGAEFPQMGLRGAIAQNWAVLDQSNAESVSAFVASRDVAKAQSKNTDLSRVQRSKAQPMEQDSLDEETVLQVSDRRPDATQNPRTSPKKLTKDDNRRSTAGQRVNPMQITQSDLDEQDGKVVGKVRSAAKLGNVDVTKESNLARQIENRVLGQPEMVATKRVIEREGITIKTNMGTVNKHVQKSQEDEGVVVGKVRHAKTRETEGITIKDTSGPRGAEEPVIIKGANGPSAPVLQVSKVQPKAGKLSTKHQTAILVCPDFPTDWNFMAPVSDRVSRAKKLLGSFDDDGVQFLKALYVSEGNSMKKVLKKTYPQVFTI
jgi:hypothetical protein